MLAHCQMGKIVKKYLSGILFAVASMHYSYHDRTAQQYTVYPVLEASKHATVCTCVLLLCIRLFRFFFIFIINSPLSVLFIFFFCK